MYTTLHTLGIYPTIPPWVHPLVIASTLVNGAAMTGMRRRQPGLNPEINNGKMRHREPLSLKGVTDGGKVCAELLRFSGKNN